MGGGRAWGGREMNVPELTAEMETTQPNGSKHLRLLQEGGFVGRRQAGSSVYSSMPARSSRRRSSRRRRFHASRKRSGARRTGRARKLEAHIARARPY